MSRARHDAGRLRRSDVRSLAGMPSHEDARPRSPIELVPIPPFYARHPVVADANVLFQDTQRYLKDGFTALTFLARHDVITLLTSEHVRRRIPEIIDEKSRSPAQLHRVWRRVYLPLIRLVEVPKSMCAGHPQIDAIMDPEDDPFARLAVATAPSLLLTRDHHFSDVGLGTERWADALVILGSLVELDIGLYGTAHAVVVVARLLGLFVSWAGQALASEPIAWIVVGAGTLALIMSDPEETIRRVRGFAAAGRRGFSRLLELSEPAFERRELAEGKLQSLLEAPMRPRNVESVCARELATRRGLLSTEDLLSACHQAGHKLELTPLRRGLERHPSFTTPSADAWELGALGVPVVEGKIG
jgi:hypothetical protein